MLRKDMIISYQINRRNEEKIDIKTGYYAELCPSKLIMYSKGSLTAYNIQESVVSTVRHSISSKRLLTNYNN